MNWRKVVSLTVIAACMFSVPASAMAKGGKTEAPKEKVEKEVKVDSESTVEADESTVESTSETIKEKVKNIEWKAVKDALEADKDAIEASKEEVEGKLAELEAAYEAAKASGDEAAIKAAQEAVAAAKLEMTELKAEMNDIKGQMKEVIKNKYTQEELDALKQVAEEIQQAETDVEVIPVENIYSKKGNFKFDVPPVIKQGRTLIPVRAITEGLGAEVKWNGEAQEVTIEKDGVVIIFNLKTGIVLVNGEEKELDVRPGMINNRTMVPLRFIAETLGLNVEYDKETGVIDIEEGQTDDTDVENQEETVVTVEPDGTMDDDTTVTVEPSTDTDTDTDTDTEDATVANVEPVTDETTAQ
ncbi:hypothetical protein HNQ80_003682 [Anaerosolibacter carboniphilus]|uniref:Copper amine oxidase-like N-terminal domain-containing protein n=1 Tax=Anaerosolibacter carboniphilus TaxID=1417629 RepID=A0A841L570_9FIRM|nr:copper amine oxidase N-terminal domain-containing protein [Anaerosolibacter carboniphilus]MBB6217559.1 hypothetical protein [Anaerosolibacter carboniphilus]